VSKYRPDSKTTKESSFIRQRLEALRKNVLDLTVRNPLVSVKLSTTSAGALRVVNAYPDDLARDLLDQKTMAITPLPALDDNPPEERTPVFQRELRPLLEEYRKKTKSPTFESPSDADVPPFKGGVPAWERRIRDKLRTELGMEKRPDKSDPESLKKWARKNGVEPDYDLRKTSPGFNKTANSRL
jgi:hypothetical protein